MDPGFVSEPTPIPKRPAPDLLHGAPITKKRHVMSPVDTKVANLMNALSNEAQFVNWSKELDDNTLGKFLALGLSKYPEEQAVWSRVFQQMQAPNHIPIKLVSIDFGQGCICTLPDCVWQVHSPYFFNMAKSQIEDNPILITQENIPIETLQAFIQCLEHVNAANILTNTNYENISDLAYHFKIGWLLKQCHEFVCNIDENFIVNDITAKANASDWNSPDDNLLGTFLFHFIQRYPPQHPGVWESAFKKILPHLEKLAKNKGNLQDDTQMEIIEPPDLVSVPFALGQDVYTCTLPGPLWKFHSDYFVNMTTNIAYSNPILREDGNIGINSIHGFIQCLEQCSSEHVLKPENYQDIFNLARKYQVSWLISDCKRFYPIYNLTQAIAFENSEEITSCVVKFIQEDEYGQYIQFPAQWREILDHLADEHQLVDLKLYATGCPLRIRRDREISIIGIKIYHSGEVLSEKQATYIKNCLLIKNHWHSPKIELAYDYPGPDDVNEGFAAINKILESNFDGEVRIFFGDQKVLFNLNEMLQQYTLLKPLELVFDNYEEKATLISLLKENKSLESLSIVAYGYFDRPPDELKDAIKNSNIKNVSIEEMQFNKSTMIGEQIGFRTSSWDF